MEWLTEDMVLDGIDAIFNPKVPKTPDRSAVFAKLFEQAKAKRITGQAEGRPDVPPREETVV